MQTSLPDPGAAQPYLDALEHRIRIRMEELLKEQTKELTEVMLGRTSHIDHVHGQVAENSKEITESMLRHTSRFHDVDGEVMRSMEVTEILQKAQTFQGFIHSGSPEPFEPKRSDSTPGTHMVLTKVMQPEKNSCLQKAAQSSTCRSSVIFLIVLQSAVLGWEASLRLSLEKERLGGSRSDSALPTYFTWFEHFFMIVFALEWLFRVLAWRKKFFDCTDREFFAWNLFDTFLIISSCLTDFDIRMSWLRSFRLFRMARILRIFRLAKKLRKMAYALLRAIDSIFWLIVLIALMLYIFSLITMNYASDYMKDFENAEYQERKCGDPDAGKDLLMVLDRFGSLESTMLSLLATFTGGAEWDSLFKPLMSFSPFFSIFVIFFVFLFVFAVMNVVTGVFVEDAMKIAQTDESLAVAETIESEKVFESDVERLMSTIDDDNDGLLNCDQLLEALKKETVRRWLAVRDIDVSVEDARRIMHIFGYMSHPFDSKVLLNIFKKIRGSARRSDLIVTAHDLRDGQKELHCILEALKMLYKQISDLESRAPMRRSPDHIAL